jgi:Zn-dependent protease
MPDFQTLLIWVIPVIFAITVHEAAHGWVASKLGDTTAKMLGRISLNPIKHIDPIGTIVVPAFLYFTTGFVFGWARPVPINYNALNRPKIDMAWVALGGPMSNFMMAILWLGFLLISIDNQWRLMGEMAQIGIQINLILAVLNLLPLPPLDGSRVISALLPRSLAYYYAQLERYGLYILLGLLFLGVFEKLIIPIVLFLQNLLYTWAGLI